MKSTLTLFTLMGLLLADTSIPLVGAEKKTPATSPSATVLAESQKRKVDELAMRDMTLNDAISLVHDHYPEFNFIPPLTGGDLKVNLTLRSVNLQEILKAMELAFEGYVRISRPDERMVVFQMSSGPRVARTSARVFNISTYLAGKSEDEVSRAIKDLYEAIEIAWDMMRQESHSGDSRVPQLKLHPGTKLLIAAGGVEELEILEQIVREIQGQTAGYPMMGMPVRGYPGGAPQYNRSQELPGGQRPVIPGTQTKPDSSGGKTPAVR